MSSFLCSKGQAFSMKAQAILIDDDELVRLSWAYFAKKKGVILDIYKSKEEFLENLRNLPKDIDIYIDSNLSLHSKGEDLAEFLASQQFSSLYLTTGYDPSKFSNLKFLKGIIGKSPPWR